MQAKAVSLQNAMGEFAGGVRQQRDEVEACERFLKRLDGYRRHHMNSRNQFDNYMNSVYEQQRQDTQILHQNWIESRSKKVGKSKLARHGQNNTSTTSVTQKIVKQKSDICSQSSSVAAVNSTVNSTQLSLATPTSSLETFSSVEIESHNRVRVNMANGLQHTQNEVTVNLDNQNAKSHSEIESDAISVMTADPCKLESKNIHCGMKLVPNPSPTSGTEPIDIGDIDGDIDGLSDFLMDTDEDFFKGLDFDSDYNQDHKLPVSSGDLLVTEEGSRDNFGTTFTNGMMVTSAYTEPAFGANVSANVDMIIAANPPGTAPVTPLVRLPLEPCTAGAAPSTPAILSDTGPAAETLKQMAAQHQSLENAQYLGLLVDFGQDGFCSRYPPSATCYLGAGSNSRRYPSVAQNIYGTGYGSQLTRNHGAVSESMQGDPASEISAAGYPSDQRTLSHFADATPLPSSLQQLEYQVQSHFGACTPPAHHLAQKPMQHPKVHSASASGNPFNVSDSQMGVEVGQVHLLSVAQQQSFSITSDHRLCPGVRSDVCNKIGRTHHIYQSQQQQAYNSFGNGMQHQMPSGAQLPNYQNISSVNRNHCVSATSNNHNVALNKATDPLLLECMRSASFTGSPTGLLKQNTGHSSSNPPLLINSNGLSTVPNMTPYCQLMKQNVLQKQSQRVTNMVVAPKNLHNQCMHAPNGWSSIKQHRQPGPQHGEGDPRLMCSHGGSGHLPSYDGGANHYGALVDTSGLMEMSVVDRDLGQINQLNQWTVASSLPLSSASHVMQHATQQQNLVHHGLGMMATKVIHVSENIPAMSQPCLPASSSVLAGHSHCYMTDQLAVPFTQTLDFMRNRETRVSDCNELQPQNIMVDLPSIY